MNKAKLLTIAAAIAIAGTSCEKTNSGVVPYNYTYYNKTDKDINIDIYETADDYNKNTNVYIKGVAPAGGSFVIPSTDFEAQKKYFVDWYTNDYTYTNWMNRQGFYDEFYTSFVPSDLKNYNNLESVSDYARIVFLNGGAATESRWTAVDGVAYPQGNTTEWADLPESYRYRKLVLKKDFSCTYYVKNDTSGLIQNSKLTFRTPYQGTPRGASEGMIYINIEDQQDRANIGIVTYSINNNATDSAGVPAIGDSIVLDLGDEGRYIMVRDTAQVQ